VLTSYYSVHHCESCDRYLSHEQRMHSGGRCPLCGHKGERACTIVATNERCVEQVQLRPWWALWRGPMFSRRIVERDR
jgi:hypothetical protein